MIKKLYWDAEVVPNLGFFWKPGRKITINHDAIVKERAICCIGYRWGHEKKTHVLNWDSRQNDYAMLREFLPIVNSADVLIAHFGDSYDLKWLKGRCLFHGIYTFPTYKTIDTCAVARKNFLLNSYALDYLAKYLGLPGKLKTDFGLWRKVALDNDRQALSYMAKYCGQDVNTLFDVWKKMEPLVKHSLHAGVMAGRDKWTCPHCASKDVKISKTRVSANGSKLYQFQCQKDGRYYSVNQSVKNKYDQAHE